MSDIENGDSHSDADSYVISKRRKNTRSRSHSRRRISRSRSTSRPKKRYSRSRSPIRKRRRSKYSRSRSRSYSPAGRRHGGEGGSRHKGSRSVSPMSQRRRHVGNRERPETSKCIGVFGLSLYTQERDLREAFSRYGPMDDVQVVYDHQSGRSRGFAFMYFRNEEDAIEAKDRAPGTEIDGRKIRVDYSITRRAHTPTPGIYLGRPGAPGLPTPLSNYTGGRRSRSPMYRGGYYRSRSRSRSYSPPPRRGYDRRGYY